MWIKKRRRKPSPHPHSLWLRDLNQSGPIRGFLHCTMYNIVALHNTICIYALTRGFLYCTETLHSTKHTQVDCTKCTIIGFLNCTISSKRYTAYCCTIHKRFPLLHNARYNTHFSCSAHICTVHSTQVYCTKCRFPLLDL